MEAEAFWELFKEYEDAGGDGYIHTVVQPAMNLLKVIDIEDAVSVAADKQQEIVWGPGLYQGPLYPM